MRRWLAGVGVAAMLVTPAMAMAQAGDEPGGSGVVVQLGRDAVVDGEPVGLVGVAGGDAEVGTEAGTVIVLDGTARLRTGAEVATLVVVNGSAVLEAGSRVGDVWLTNATVSRDDAATVTGTVRRTGDQGFAGRWLTRLVLALGLALLVIVVGLTGAAAAPSAMRRTAALVTDSPGATILAALAAWILVPLSLVLVAVSFVGLPTALVYWICAMPLLGLTGYAVVGLRVGQAILKRPEPEGQPLMPTFVGVLTLVVLGQVPGVGWIVGLGAAFVGGGAVALAAWRAIRGERPRRSDPVPILPA